MPTNQSTKLACLSIFCLAITSLEAGACNQDIDGFNAVSDTEYIFRAEFVDNIVQVRLNNTTLLDYKGNGSTSELRALNEFLKKGENKLIVEGFNEAYGAGAPHANPGKITYSILRRKNSGTPTELTRKTCESPHSDAQHEVRIFEHKYIINVP